jgi:integrase
VVVEAETSKKRKRRVVYPRPEAMGALQAALAAGSLPIDINARMYELRKLRPVLGLAKLPQDGTRHTAASYWLATGEISAGQLAEQLGNSESILKRHYDARATRASAADFWRIVASFAHPQPAEVPVAA